MTSGYTNCACRDCMDITVSGDTNNPGKCFECQEAGCETFRIGDPDYDMLPSTMKECQRDDAYTFAETTY